MNVQIDLPYGLDYRMYPGSPQYHLQQPAPYHGSCDFGLFQMRLMNNVTSISLSPLSSASTISSALSPVVSSDFSPPSSYASSPSQSPSSLSNAYGSPTWSPPPSNCSSPSVSTPPSLPKPFIDTLPLPTTRPRKGPQRKKAIAAAKSSAAKHKRNDPNHIPRPPNSFILFRNDYARRCPSSGVKGQGFRSQSAAVTWRLLPAAEKTLWEAKAAMEKVLHTIRYPDYVYTPKKRTTTKSTRNVVKYSTDFILQDSSDWFDEKGLEPEPTPVSSSAAVSAQRPVKSARRSGGAEPNSRKAKCKAQTQQVQVRAPSPIFDSPSHFISLPTHPFDNQFPSSSQLLEQELELAVCNDPYAFTVQSHAPTSALFNYEGFTPGNDDGTVGHLDTINPDFEYDFTRILSFMDSQMSILSDHPSFLFQPSD